MRWNKDRASAVLGAGSNTYDSRLLCAINNLSEEVLGKAIDTSFTALPSSLAPASSTNGRAQKLIELWSKLTPYDKKAVTFSPRHQPKLSQGHFKSRGSKSSVVPVVDSTKR